MLLADEEQEKDEHRPEDVQERTAGGVVIGGACQQGSGAATAGWWRCGSVGGDAPSDGDEESRAAPANIRGHGTQTSSASGLLVAGVIFLIMGGVVLWILGVICVIGGVGALLMTWQRRDLADRDRVSGVR